MLKPLTMLDALTDEIISPSESSSRQLQDVLSHVDQIFEYVAHCPCIYFLFKEKQLHYIGKTINLDSRIKEHQKQKDFDQVFHISIEERMLESVETALIRFYQPKLNTCKKASMTNKDEIVLSEFCGITV